MNNVFLGSEKSPRDVSGLVFWFEPSAYSTLTFNGGNVSQITPYEGNRSLVMYQGTAAQQPQYDATGINGRPGIKFYHDSTAKRMQVDDGTALDYTQSYTLVHCFKRHTDLGVTERVAGKYSTASPLNAREYSMAIGSTDDMFCMSSSDGTGGTLITTNAGGAIALNTPTVGSMWYNPSDQKVYAQRMRGTAVASAGTIASVFAGTAPFFWGARDSLSEPSGITGGSLLLYNRMLTASELDFVVYYVQKLNGIAS